MADNNPFNLRRTKDVFEGSSAVQRDKSFIDFDTPEASARALGKIFMTYNRKGIDTVGKAINRYAPPADNNPTAAYADFVAKRLGVDVDDRIDLTDTSTAQSLAESIAVFEGTKLPITSAQIGQGLVDAGFQPTLTQASPAESFASIPEPIFGVLP